VPEARLRGHDHSHVQGSGGNRSRSLRPLPLRVALRAVPRSIAMPNAERCRVRLSRRRPAISWNDASSYGLHVDFRASGPRQSDNRRDQMKKAVLFALALILLLHPLPLLSGEHTSNPNQVKLPPARAIPGLTEEDKFPLGCVDCHINMPERNQDERIGTLMSRWAEKVEPGLLEKAQAVAPAGITLKGVHPKVTRSLENIPTACLRCHSKTSKKTPPLAPLLHTIHLSGGAGNHFLTIFQGECTHCHKMDKRTGNWSIPSGPER